MEELLLISAPLFVLMLFGLIATIVIYRREHRMAAANA
jgi:hypothetical protein